MTERTAEEAKAAYIEKMGPELGTQFYRLSEEMFWLYMKWGEYDALFGAGSKRVDLLNEAAPTFFWMVEQVFWEDMLLHIARLTDKSESMGKKNLTIQNLPELVDPAIKSTLQQSVDTTLAASKFCVDWRNRRIAHNDLDLAINIVPARPLESADKETVVNALIALQKVLVELEEHYFQAETVHIPGPILRGVTDLLQVLYFGTKEQAKANERIRCQKATEEDYPALALKDETEPNNLS